MQLNHLVIITLMLLGCGNGMLLIGLYKENFKNLHGIDYSEKAIELASSISQAENCVINFTVGSILDDTAPSSYKVVLDKGTYDAISLNPDNSNKKRETYKQNVHKMLKDDGIFLLTSCNWTEDEIIQQFAAGNYHDNNCLIFLNVLLIINVLQALIMLIL